MSSEFSDALPMHARNKSITTFIKMLILKYTVYYQYDLESNRLIVHLETTYHPKINIKITDEIGCRHVHFEKNIYQTICTRYELDQELFDYLTPTELADLIEKDFEVVVAKEVE